MYRGNTCLILLNNITKNKREIVLFAVILNVFFVKSQRYLKKKLKFNTFNSDVVVWEIFYYKNDPGILTIFPKH